MKYRNTGNGIIRTFVKISFLSMSVICKFGRRGTCQFMSVMSHSLLGGREHQITHANVDIELNGV